MRKSWFLIAVLLFAVIISAVQAQEKLDYAKVNLDQLTTDTQKGSPDPDAMLFVWWVPDEFWLASFAQDETVTEKDIKEFMDSVSKYTVVGVVDGIVGNMGGVTYRSEEENRKRIKVKDAQGVYYSPLVKKQVDADVRSFSAMLKAALAEQLGEMGKNMQFFFFPAKTKDGSRFASPTQTGKFTVKLGDEEMHWKLPLASLLVPKNCPKCSESLHGGYSFCPWDGTKLP